MHKKPPRIRLIDDTDFLIQRVREHEEKPETMFRSPAHLAWIRLQPCVMCGKTGCQAAHLRLGTNTAKGVKPHDFWCWPGDDYCHVGIQHTIGEKSFWWERLKIPDPHQFILVNYAIKSPCSRTVAAARQELERRHAA